MRSILSALFLLVAITALNAQNSGLGKLSPWLRQLAFEQRRQNLRVGPVAERTNTHDRMVCAFVRLSDDDALSVYGCQSLTKVGDIHVAMIPVGQLSNLATDSRVNRVEARPMGQTLLDTLSCCINATDVHQGRNLPQAYTGKDVLVGLMDIGFDLTHPTFYSRDMQYYRIKALWDMLSRDTIGSTFPVGRDYEGNTVLQMLAHSYDGNHQAHGTHTAGIAAGSGYDSPYQGLAPEADICLVANAVSNNAALIDSSLLDRFTFATDALGFKYIFDYAKREEKPCVISFSEGSSQDFWGYDQLYYEMLDSLVGPGRILVASAGNLGHVKSWFRKERGFTTKGTFLQGSEKMYCTLKSPENFVIRLVGYGVDRNDTLLVQTSSICEREDSLLTFTHTAFDSLQIQAYPSCYDPHEVCYDLMFYSKKTIGYELPLSLEVVGIDADVEMWRGSCMMVENVLNSSLNAGEKSHNIYSPSSAPRVVCVGATTYRDSILNKDGVWKSYWLGEQGYRVAFSSVGPTMDGRIKPDVVAPGNNIISSYNSYCLESHPTTDDRKWNVSEFPFNNRIYAWNSNSGTSMSCPAVAGSIALWLQANPSLTPEDVKAVLKRTCRHPDASLSYPNNEYGYGEIDVYRGLLDILQVNKMEKVSASHTNAKVRLSSGNVYVELSQPATTDFQMHIYSLAGREVAVHTFPAGQQVYSMSIRNLPAAIYVLQFDGDRQVNGSTLIRVR